MRHLSFYKGRKRATPPAKETTEQPAAKKSKKAAPPEKLPFDEPDTPPLYTGSPED